MVEFRTRDYDRRFSKVLQGDTALVSSSFRSAHKSLGHALWGLVSDTGRTVVHSRRMPDEVLLGQLGNGVGEQGPQIVNLLTPHAVAAKVCAGEVVGVDYPSRQVYELMSCSSAGRYWHRALITAIR
jgi:hypothetical protein